MILAGKVIVVTGASSGIGYALTKQLLDEGAHVFAVSRSIEDTDLEHDYLIKKNFDLSNEKHINTLFDDAIQRYGHIDAFVANAGFAYYETFQGKDFKHIEHLMKLDLYSVMISAQKMKEINKTHPFNFMATLSAVSYVPMPGYAVYTAAKASLKGFIESYQLELDKDQILQAVYPVATDTKFFTVADQDHKPWPVQSSETVARAMVKGLKRNRKRIYPSKIFWLGIKLFPWVFVFYKKRQRKLFHKIMSKDKK
ncbi:MAG: SDR family NAD(P)-dependent oxidoreductase [Bacillota bacterium]